MKIQSYLGGLFSIMLTCFLLAFTCAPVRALAHPNNAACSVSEGAFADQLVIQQLSFTAEPLCPMPVLVDYVPVAKLECPTSDSVHVPEFQLRRPYAASRLKFDSTATPDQVGHIAARVHSPPILAY